MNFWKNVFCVISTYGFFFFVPWLLAFRLLAEMADDNAITHWQNNEQLSKKGNIGTLLLAVFLLIVAGQILTFRTKGFPFLVAIETALVLTYSIGFDITSDVAVMITLGLCTLIKICHIVWKYLLNKYLFVSSVNSNVNANSSCKDTNTTLPLPSVHLSLSDMEEIPIENDNPAEQ